jgi:hypothetical protein
VLTHWFPQFPNLMMTGSRLYWYVLSVVKPPCSETVEHMILDGTPVGVEKLGDGRDVYMESAAVEYLELFVVVSV